MIGPVVQSDDLGLSDIRRISKVVTATGDIWNGVSSGAVSWSWDAEATEVSDDATTFAQPAITIHTARWFVPISVERDSISCRALEPGVGPSYPRLRMPVFSSDMGVPSRRGPTLKSTSSEMSLLTGNCGMRVPKRNRWSTFTG